MKSPKLRAVTMVRRIRDRYARVLAGKSDAEIIAFYRSAGVAAAGATPTSRQGAPAKKAVETAGRRAGKARSQRSSRSARG